MKARHLMHVRGIYEIDLFKTNLQALIDKFKSVQILCQLFSDNKMH